MAKRRRSGLRTMDEFEADIRRSRQWNLAQAMFARRWIPQDEDEVERAREYAAICFRAAGWFLDEREGVKQAKRARNGRAK